MRKSKYIKSIGVEIEGGVPYYENTEDLEDWLKHKFSKYQERISVGVDGSVCVGKVFEFDNVYDNALDNVEIRFYSENIKDVLNFGQYCFNELNLLQNETCGNHIHLKISDEYLPLVLWDDYVFFMEDEYIKKYKNIEKYMKRITNKYCLFSSKSKNVKRFASFYLKEKLLGGGQDFYSGFRYHSVNFLALEKTTRTVEIRMMPYADNIFEWESMVKFVYYRTDKFFSNFWRKGVSMRVVPKINDAKILKEEKEIKTYEKEKILGELNTIKIEKIKELCV